MEVAYSVDGVPIRLTYERWYHIVENHDELASYFHEVLDKEKSYGDSSNQENGGFHQQLYGNSNRHAEVANTARMD